MTSTDLAVLEPEVLAPGEQTLAELAEIVTREHTVRVLPVARYQH